MVQPSQEATGRPSRSSLGRFVGSDLAAGVLASPVLVPFAVAVLAAAVALTSGAAPTGISQVDLLYTAATGASFSLAGGLSRRWTWILSSGAAVWVGVGVTGKLLALVALGVAVGSVWTRRPRWAGALLTVPLIGVLGGLGSGSFHGSTTLVAVVVATPILMSASFQLSDSARQIVIAFMTIAVSFTVLAAVALAAAAFLALGNITDGVDAVNAGYDAIGAGDDPAAADQLTAADHFDVAADEFRSARQVFGGPWLAPARLVPLVGQHVLAARTIVDEGVNLTETAAEVSRRVDLDSVHPTGGRVDLAAVDAMVAPLGRAELALAGAVERIDEARESWLISPIDERLGELGDRLEDALPAARTASLAAGQVPTLLGRGGPVRWFVAITSPAEARGLGGVLDSYATVIAADGVLAFETVGRAEDLEDLLRETDSAAADAVADVTTQPDLPTVAAAAAALYEQATGDPVDGVIMADPFVVGAILELTGAVNAAGVTMEPTAAVDFLVADQYTDYEDDEIRRVATLNALIVATLEALLTGTLPGPRGLAAELGPVVDQDRLGAWWADAATTGPAELMAAAGLDGRFPDPVGGDLLGVIHQNRGRNKIDLYLDRAVTYETSRDGNRITGKITISLTNSAPVSGLPDTVIGSDVEGLPLGTNSMDLSVYSALEVSALRVDGREVGLAEMARSSELGVGAVTVPVDIPGGSTVTVEVEVSGDVADPDRLTIVDQPLVNDGIVRVVAAEPGSTPAQGSRPLREDTILTVGS